MRYSLGFDGGGTKTECVILDANGAVVGIGSGGPSNPLRCGYDAAFQSLGEAAAEALKKAGIDTGKITGVCAGLAGAGGRSVVRRVLVYLAHEFPRAVAHVATDYEVALESAVGNGPGVVLIAGTGSVAYGRNAEGDTARAGGYGPWIGDEGSAFEIGRRAVAAVARARDQAGQSTILTDIIPDALDCPDWSELVQRIATAPDEVFPKLFVSVAAAAEAGDRAASEILFTAAIGLVNLASTVIHRLRMTEIEFPAIKYGGVFGHSTVFDSLVESNLTAAASHARISYLGISAAIGAARLATRLSASATPVRFRNFQPNRPRNGL